MWLDENLSPRRYWVICLRIGIEIGMNTNCLIMTGAASIALFVAGCATEPRSVDWPEARMLGRDLPAYRAPQQPQPPTTTPPAALPTGDITLRAALAAALLHNPTLSVYAWEVRIREARAIQASLPPNPEVELEVEDFGGTGAASGLDGAESTLLISQIIELGHKRERRTRAAELDQDLAAWDYEATRIAVLADTSRAFIEALALQERLALAQNNLDLAQQVFEVIEKQVQAGATSPLDQTKAGLVVARAKITLRRVQRNWEAARVTLATAWGSRQPAFDRLVGAFDQLSPLPPQRRVFDRITQNPQIARWASEVAQRRAQIEVERSKGVPSFSAGAGVKYLGELNDTAAVIQFSIPLPLVDKNQGGVLESRYALAKARQAQRALELRINAALDQAYRRLAGAHEEVTALKRDVLPAAEMAHDGTKAAYTQGKIGYLDVLDAQRTLFEARAQHVEALAAYHAAVVDVESLIGQPLDTLNENTPTTPATPNTPDTPLTHLNPTSIKGVTP